MKCGTLVHCRCDKNTSNEGVNYVCPNCKHDNSDEDSEMPSFMVCRTLCCFHICFQLLLHLGGALQYFLVISYDVVG